MTVRKTLPQILVIHGPNLNLLGVREPEVYGHTKLRDIDAELARLGTQWGLEVRTFQSNHEGAIVDEIQNVREHVDGIIINPAAYTHTSIAIRDALLASSVPVIEVHLSNIHKREEFRHRSMLAGIVSGQIIGLGANGYYLALRAMSTIVGVEQPE